METEYKKAMNIGKKIKKLRKSAGSSKAQIARFLGVKKMWYQKAENGKFAFTISELERLCELFCCDLDDIINDDAEVNPIIAICVNKIENENLVAIADINRIVINLSYMRKLNNKEEK